MNAAKPNILFAHSGGVTAVINTVASALAKISRENQHELYISPMGIIGLKQDPLIAASSLTASEWENIHNSPSSSFGSSRAMLPDDPDEIKKMFDHFNNHDIGVFICNGGNGSQSVTLAMHNLAKEYGYPLNCIGIPKTIDNDLNDTDSCPGYGSAAKYTAVSIAEISLDIAAICKSSTQVLIYESMGRNAGWLAAASALAKTHEASGPHIILLPEANFSISDIMRKTKTSIQKYGHCVICIAEGAMDRDKLLKGHITNHVSFALSDMISQKLRTKNHVVIPDYLQRSARHLASKTDIEQAEALTQHAYQLAKEQQSGIMVTLVRNEAETYSWSPSHTDLHNVASQVRRLPSNYVSEDQMFVTTKCIDHIAPLIIGEVHIPFESGIPCYSDQIYRQLLEQQEQDHD